MNIVSKEAVIINYNEHYLVSHLSLPTAEGYMKNHYKHYRTNQKFGSVSTVQVWFFLHILHITI